MKAHHYLWTLVLITIALLGASTCGRDQDKSGSGPGLTLKSIAPPDLISGQAITGLKAEVILDGDTTNPLVLGINPDDSCYGTIFGIPVGNHEVALRYYVLYGATPPPPQFKLILAEQTREVEVVKDKAVTLSFPQANYLYPDDDSDTMSNLYEYQFDLDPFVACHGCPYKIGADLRMTRALEFSEDPFLAWTGSEYGVSWGDGRDGIGQSYFSRLSAGGVKIGMDLRIPNDLAGSGRPCLAWTGSEFGVSWVDTLYPHFVRISAEGSKVGSDLEVTSIIGNDEPSLVWTGSEYGLSWQNGSLGSSEIYFARISVDGNKIGSDLRVTSETSISWYPSLAWSGSEFAVSWADWRDGAAPEIYFARVSLDGAKIGAELRLTSDLAVNHYPSLVWTGSEYGLSWSDSRDGNKEIYFARLSNEGTKIGSDVRITIEANNSNYPSLAWTGSEFGVSWEDDRNGNSEIFFARVSSSGIKIGSDLRVTRDANESGSPSLIWAASQFGVSWHDGRDGNFEIYFARIGFTP